MDFFVAGVGRKALILAPRPASRSPRPLVVVLPGFHQTAYAAEKETAFDDAAAAGGMVVTYVYSKGGSWNAGDCCGSANKQGIDDVAGIDELIRRVHRTVPFLDPHRTVLAGFSNGAMMAYRYACERPSSLAGIIVVAGSLQYRPCRPNQVSVVEAHYANDHVVPRAGGYSRLLMARLTSWEASLAQFTGGDGCSIPLSSTRLSSGWEVTSPRCDSHRSVHLYVNREVQGNPH